MEHASQRGLADWHTLYLGEVQGQERDRPPHGVIAVLLGRGGQELLEPVAVPGLEPRRLAGARSIGQLRRISCPAPVGNPVVERRGATAEGGANLGNRHPFSGQYDAAQPYPVASITSGPQCSLQRAQLRPRQLQHDQLPRETVARTAYLVQDSVYYRLPTY